MKNSEIGSKISEDNLKSSEISSEKFDFDLQSLDV